MHIFIDLEYCYLLIVKINVMNSYLKVFGMRHNNEIRQITNMSKTTTRLCSHFEKKMKKNEIL